MTTTQISITILALSLSSVAIFGGFKYASAHTFGHSWKGHVMHQVHALTDEDWENAEKIQEIKEMCVDRSLKRFDRFIEHAASELEITNGQSQTWDSLVSSLQNEKDTISLVCEKLLTRENTEDLPARLELFSSMIAIGQESLQRLTPPINDFYSTLSDEQKEVVDEMMTRHQ